MLKRILDYTQKLQLVPNVPFLVKPINEYITENVNKNKYSFIDNNYSVIVRALKNSNKPKLIIMAHTDHPGIIIKNKNRGIAMGTLETDRLRTILANKPIKLKIFDPGGKYLGTGNLIDIKKNNRDVSLKVDFDVPSNSFGQYDINYFKTSDKSVSAYTLDDTISVAVMLSLLEHKFESDYDVYFVFNLYEEVHQISSWYLAKNNILKINKDDIIINLESQKVENVENKFGLKLNYSSGPILQLSNTGCLFGYRFNGKNESEIIVSNIAKTLKSKIQIGFAKDSDDSRPFSFFSTTANITTLNIPNKYKHNCDDNGRIIPEFVYKKDIEIVSTIIQEIIQSKPNGSKDAQSISEKVKKDDTITDTKLMKEKAELNERLNYAYKYIVKRGYFYPQNFRDHIQDIVSKFCFYSLYVFQKIGLFK